MVQPQKTSEVQTKIIETSSHISTELEAAIWALESTESGRDVRLYTDSQTIADLPKRRNKLEVRQFRSRKTGNLLSNAHLYQRFFEALDERQVTISWIKGHKPSAQKTMEDLHFQRVDRTVRQLLRSLITG